MGQRLNIHIRLGEKEIMNSYFHWSAYSYPAAEMTSSIISKLTEMMEDDGLEICDFATLKYSTQLKYATEALHSVGAGFTDDEINKIIKTLPNHDRSEIKFYKAVNRNEGFIGITKDTRKSYAYWEEGSVIIDLEAGKIDFDVYFSDSMEDYREFTCVPEYCEKSKMWRAIEYISEKFPKIYKYISKSKLYNKLKDTYMEKQCKKCKDFHNMTRKDESDLMDLNSLDIDDIGCLVYFIERYENGIIYNHNGVDYVIYWIM